jgi:chromosome segregation ATPase
MSWSIDRLEREISQLYSAINSLNSLVYDLVKIQDKVVKELNRLGKEIEGIKDEMNEIKEKVSKLEDDLEKTKQELSKQINAVQHKVKEVEERVEKAEENLNDHLSQQDKVLEHNSEALLNNLVMQYVLNIVDRAASSSHIVLGYLNEKPFIVVETSEYIELILISSEVLKEDLEALNKIRDALSEYTDKEVKYNILTTSVTKTETPAWLYSVPRIH